MNASTARTVLNASVLHTEDNEFPDATLNYAIIAAGSRFLRETNCSILNTTLSVTTSLFTVTGSITGFHTDQFIEAYDAATFTLLKWVPYQTIQQLFAITTTTQSTVLSHVAPGPDGQLIFYPVPDGGGVSVLLYSRAPFVDQDSFALIPDEWAYQVLWTGAKGYLLQGLPNHPDADIALQAFEQLIQEAKTHFRVGDPGLVDVRSNMPPAIRRGV